MKSQANNGHFLSDLKIIYLPTWQRGQRARRSGRPPELWQHPQRTQQKHREQPAAFSFLSLSPPITYRFSHRSRQKSSKKRIDLKLILASPWGRGLITEPLCAIWHGSCYSKYRANSIGMVLAIIMQEVCQIKNLTYIIKRG